MSEDFFYLYSVDPDEMQHYAAFHLGLYSLQKYSFLGFPEYKGLLIAFVRYSPLRRTSLTTSFLSLISYRCILSMARAAVSISLNSITLKKIDILSGKKSLMCKIVINF